jgi:hypothetical protein
MSNEFISKIEQFNKVFGKLNNNSPTIDIPQFEKKFIYDFILEELEEYKESYENNDLVGIADSFGDIMVVLCAGILAYGLQDKFSDIFNEIHSSNMSKACKTEQEAIETSEIRSKQLGVETYYEKVGEYWVVYRTNDRKVLKSLSYFPPNLKKILEK